MGTNSREFAWGLLCTLTLMLMLSPAHAQPDVIVAELPSAVHYGPVGSMHAYAVGTTSCNMGDAELQWISSNNQHPVITQNLFRLSNDRFEMIGQGWLKHGFCALSGTVCGPCDSTPCDTLGTGCSDPYSASLNGSQGGLGPKSEINASTGVFPYPFSTQGSTGNEVFKRIQVPESDLTVAGARYFVTSHYVTPDEPPAGTDLNNESYREVTVTGSFGLSMTGPTVREKYAVEAWQAIDPSVTITNVDIPGDGRFVVAAKAVPDGANWRYEYAIENYHSHRSSDGLSIPLPAGAVVSNIGFRDIDYHSGEIYSNADWTGADNGSSVDWTSPETYAQNPDTNALRWDTVYNFWFTCDLPPSTGLATLDLFRPGTPSDATFTTVVPATSGSPPFNDTCANAISVTEGTTGFTTLNATTDGPAESCGAIADDVWYRYTAPCDGDAIFGTCGSSFDTQIAIYTGGCPVGSALACNDDSCGSQSELTVTVANGTEYWVRIGGPAQGNGTLTVTDPVCGGNGGNDDCVDAIALAEGVPTAGSTSNATNDGTASCATSSTTPDVWYTYTPFATGDVTISTCDDANYDSALAVFDSCGGTEVACLDDTTGCAGNTQTLTTMLTGGVEYRIRVSGYDGAVGDFTITVTQAGSPTGPANDNCQDREGIGLGSLPFDTTGATTDGPAHPECAFFSYDQVGSDIWYNYPSTFNGTITISTCGSGYDTKIAVYDDAGCGDLETRIMDCNDDSCGLQSELTIPVIIGRNYTIRIGGYNGATGSGTVTITGVPEDDCALVTPGLALHLESDNGVTTSGSTVTAWSDQSGQGNDLTAFGAPALVAGATNGQAAVRLDGVDDRLGRTSAITGLPTGNGDRTIFLVASYDNAAEAAFSYGSAGCGAELGLGVSTGGDLATTDGCTAFGTLANGNGAGWLVQSAIVAGSTLRHFVNGAQIDDYGPTLSTTATAIALGADLSSSNFSDMDVAAVLVYDRALTEAERAEVEGYLALKYLGVTCDGNLPPFADDDFAAVDQGDAIAIDVLANDSDDGSIDATSVVIVTAPANGTVTVNGTTGEVTYDHDDSATTSDVFVYNVMDDLGRVSNDALVSVTINPCVPPAFTQKPVGGTLCEGDAVTLSATANGDAPITYQWRKNGSMISGATSSSLVFSSVTAADAANYDCVATNDCGTATSTTATLTVETSPTITQQPMSQSECEGNAITLSTSATGTGPLGYQWRKNGATISGATSSSLALSNLAVGDAGNYDCQVTNGCGSATTNTSVVMVDAAPQIIAQPNSESDCSGSNVSLTVAATGAGPLTYQWRKNGTDVAGGTSPTLTLSSVQPADAGAYDCIVASACGAATSATATVTVWEAPMITSQPSGGTQCEGTSTTLNVAASSPLALSYQWRKNGAAISGANSTSFTINPLVGADAGSYDCVVSNSCGSSTSTAAAIGVDVAPSITASPDATNACDGSSATFSVAASGAAPLTYQWRKNGAAIGGATASSLTLTSVGPGDAGNYDCVVANACGTATSTSAALTIDTAPAIVSDPSTQSACVGAGVSLNVIATGSGPLAYQWRHNGSNLGGATNAILSLSNLTLADAGNYDCVVTNGCGSATSASALVDVIPTPTITAGPADVTDCEGTSATLTVSATSTLALSYQWRLDGVAISGATSASYTLASLGAADVGSYDCVVSNTCGSTISDAATVTVSTGPTVTSAPTDVAPCLGGSAQLTVVAADADSYQWRFEGTPIVGATGAQLTLSPVMTGDAGSYDVVVTNGCGSVTSASASLTPTDVPVVTVSPTDQTTCEGFDVTFFGAATSDLSLTYQWLKDGVPVPGATTSALTLALVTAAEAGTYEVQFINDCGVVTSASATLTVTPAASCDCNDNGVLDGDDISGGTSEDCNGNGIPDECDIANGTSTDANSNGVPDSCEPVGFVRGDGNGDGIVNLADAVYLLNFFFNGGVIPTCEDTADANDDTLLNLADAVFLLEWQFVDGTEPPAPFPNCGIDPTEPDGLGCLEYTGCP